jgi:hypothetical protein
MTRLRISLLAGIATIALGAFPAQALDIKAGGLSVSVDGGGSGGGGGGGGINANVDAGPDVDADVSVNGNDQDADVSANVNSNSNTQSTGGDVLDATVDLEDGIETDIDILKLRNGHAASADVDILTGEDDKVLDAFVDTGVGDANAVVRLSNTDDGTNLNAGASLDAAGTSNDVMVDLTIGGGGVAGGTVVDTDAADADISINVRPRGVDLFDLVTLPLEDDEDGDGIPPVDGVPPDTGVAPPTNIGTDPNEIRDAFNTISDEDVAALKVNCRAVLGNPAGYSDSAVAICKLAIGM